MFEISQQDTLGRRTQEYLSKVYALDVEGREHVADSMHKRTSDVTLNVQQAREDRTAG